MLYALIVKLNIPHLNAHINMVITLNRRKLEYSLSLLVEFGYLCVYNRLHVTTSRHIGFLTSRPPKDTNAFDDEAFRDQNDGPSSEPRFQRPPT